jgi:hypothetical protein
MELMLAEDEPRPTLAGSSNSVEGLERRVPKLPDATSSAVWSSTSSSDSSSSDSEADDEAPPRKEDPESDDDEVDDELSAHSEESYGPAGWQVLSRSINTWLAAEIIERSTTDDGTSILCVRYRLPEGRLRQKWVINVPSEVRRDPRMLSPTELSTPAEWGVPLSPRSPRTLMESMDHGQDDFLDPAPQPQLQPQLQPEPELEPKFDREVALATAMALSAAAAAASGGKGIPSGLKWLPEGIPPAAGARPGILQAAGGSGKTKSRFKGPAMIRGTARHVQWVDAKEGSVTTTTNVLVLTRSEVKSRRRHVLWIGEQRRIEQEEPDREALAGLRTTDSVDFASRRLRTLGSARDMSDIC